MDMDDVFVTYNEQKQQWLEEHPEATPNEIEEFCKKLAEDLDI